MRIFIFRMLLTVSGAVFFSVLFASACLAQTQREPDASPKEGSLQRFLQTFDHDKTSRYIAAFYDLNGDGSPEAIVYLMGRGWCGSGGCNTLILARDGSSWRIVSNETITWPPIRVLNTKSNGWHNLGLWVRGGGIRPGYEAELRFDGKTYPTNPSIPPARRLGEKVEGEVVIPSAEGAKLLYP
jgi:hypothetical protein